MGNRLFLPLGGLALHFPAILCILHIPAVVLRIDNPHLVGQFQVVCRLAAGYPLLLYQHACDVPAGFLVGRRQGLVFGVGALASDGADYLIRRLRGVSAVGLMRLLFFQDLLSGFELRVDDRPAIVVNLVLHFFVLVGYYFLRVSAFLDEEAVVAAHVVVVALLLGKPLEGVVYVQARLLLLALLLLPG